MSGPRRVIFFVNALGGGGAEAHTLRVMNHLDRSRWQPILGVARRGGSYEAMLAPDVPVHELALTQARSVTAQMALSMTGLRRLIRDTDAHAVCAVMELAGLAAIMATRAMRRRPAVAVCVQVPPLPQYTTSRLGRRVILPGIRRLYPHAEAVIALSRGVKQELCRIQPRLEARTRVIYNACVDARIAGESAPSASDAVPTPTVPAVVAVGRLAPVKNFAALLDAFALVRRGRAAELWILGEGPERPALERRIAELALKDSVRMFGFCKNPQEYMRRATVLALSSHYEGFGNVIVEALACGTPVVATDCPYGPGEILTHGETGLLVPTNDVPALAAAIDSVLGDEALRVRLTAAGHQRAQAFHAATIAAEYADELDRLVDHCARS